MSHPLCGEAHEALEHLKQKKAELDRIVEVILKTGSDQAIEIAEQTHKETYRAYRIIRYIADKIADPEDMIRWRDLICRELKANFVSSFDENGIACAQKDNKWFFIKALGERLGHEIFDYCATFEKEKIIPVSQGDQMFYIDRKGARIGTETYDNARRFYEGRALVDKMGIKFFINEKGRPVTTEIEESDGVFTAGAAATKIDDVWMLIDKNGNRISSDDYDHLERVGTGLFKAHDPEGVFLIDYTGKQLGEKLDQINVFFEGFARVRKSGKYFLVDMQGNQIGTETFDEVHNQYSEGYTIVGNRAHGGDMEYTFIDIRGKRLGKELYKNITNFSNGLAGVSKDDIDWFLIDTFGEQVGSELYQGVFSLKHFIIAKKDGKWILLQRNGARLGNISFEKFISTHGYNIDPYGILGVVIDNKVILVDTNGRQIGSETYDNIEWGTSGVIKAWKHGQQFFIDKTGRRIFGYEETAL